MRLKHTYIPVIVICVGVIGVAFFSTYKEHRAENTFAEAVASKSSFSDQILAYQNLMKAVGASRAQEILVATFPDNSRTHMMDHQTGKFLYDTEGFTGIGDCKTYFAGGCYHGFISAAIADRGLSDFKEIVTNCKNDLSQEQVMQCAHGVGHGLLADVAGYTKLPDALALCQSLFTGDQKSTVNCYDGIFMENNFGEFSVPPSDRWYKASDPMYPCEISAVLDKPGAHTYCWGMQSQLTLHADAYPQFAGDVKKVGAYCNTLVGDDTFICFEGLARQLQLSYSTDPARIQSECAKLGGSETVMCVAQAAEAAYIYGNHSAETLGVCTNETGADKDNCYEALYEGFAISYSATSTRLTACTRDLPEDTYKEKCTAWMNSPAALDF